MKPTDSQPSHILLPGTELPCNYIVNNVLGEGGFGITYSGTYTLTGEKVAIKEYFPTSLAHREWNADNTCRIVPFIESEDSFSKGREHFLNEASILKEFQNLNSIVSVMDVIEANDTVYLVMEFIDGITLKQYVTENGTLTFAELLPLVRPVIQALTLVHKKGLIHRDISPENLMIGIDNQLHLIDFGAASIENAHDAKTMTVILKTGYAPPEQYLSDGKQGAWTDIYGLCATMYMTLTGFQPPESIKRFQQDNLPPLASNADISSWQAAAIERGMNLAIAERYQNMEALYQALVIPPIEIDPRHAEYLKNSIEENKTVIKKDTINIRHPRLLYSFTLVVLFFTAFFTVVFLLNRSPASLTNDSKDIISSLNASTEDTSAPLCTMISLTGDSLSNAKEKLSKLDTSIKVQTQWVYNNTYAANTIINQSISANTNFTKGSLNSILLTISKGPEPSAETTTEKDSVSEEKHTNSKKSDSPNTKAATSNKSATEESEFNFTPIEEDDEYETFTID